MRESLGRVTVLVSTKPLVPTSATSRRANPTDSGLLNCFRKDRKSIADGDDPNPIAGEQQGILDVPEEGRSGGNIEIVCHGLLVKLSETDGSHDPRIETVCILGGYGVRVPLSLCRRVTSGRELVRRARNILYTTKILFPVKDSNSRKYRRRNGREHILVETTSVRQTSQAECRRTAP